LHSLSPGLLHLSLQIVQFIIANTESAPKPLDNLPVTGGFCDPFTGGSATAPSHLPPAYQLPTGPVSITGGGVDPFTGGSSNAIGEHDKVV